MTPRLSVPRARDRPRDERSAERRRSLGHSAQRATPGEIKSPWQRPAAWLRGEAAPRAAPFPPASQQKGSINAALLAASRSPDGRSSAPRRAGRVSAAPAARSPSAERSAPRRADGGHRPENPAGAGSGRGAAVPGRKGESGRVLPRVSAEAAALTARSGGAPSPSPSRRRLGRAPRRRPQPPHPRTCADTRAARGRVAVHRGRSHVRPRPGGRPPLPPQRPPVSAGGAGPGGGRRRRGAWRRSAGVLRVGELLREPLPSASAPQRRASAELTAPLHGQQCRCSTARSENTRLLSNTTLPWHDLRPSRPVREAPLVSDMGRSFGIPHPCL